MLIKGQNSALQVYPSLHSAKEFVKSYFKVRRSPMKERNCGDEPVSMDVVFDPNLIIKQEH